MPVHFVLASPLIRGILCAARSLSRVGHVHIDVCVRVQHKIYFQVLNHSFCALRIFFVCV